MAGLYFEDFKAGMVVQHAIRRTRYRDGQRAVLRPDLQLRAKLHIDAEYSADTIYGQRLVNSMFLLALVAGVTVYETTLGTTLGNLFREIVFPKPTFPWRHHPCRDGNPANAVVQEPHGLRHRDFQACGQESARRDLCTAVRTGLMMLRPAA